MNNISKNLLLGFALVCAIVVIVFSIQLVIINSGGEAAGSGSSMSGGSNDNTDDQNGEDGDEDDPATTPVPTPRPPPQGFRREIPVTQNNNLIIYYMEQLFNYEDTGFNWLFNYLGEGDAKLEISFDVISPQGVEAHMISFMNGYSGGTEAEFTGFGDIAGSELDGYHVIARHGVVVYEAWVHMIQGTDLSLRFVINYDNGQQRDSLFTVLSSMDMTAGGPGTGTQGTGNEGYV